jgi:hypothetical protein
VTEKPNANPSSPKASNKGGKDEDKRVRLAPVEVGFVDDIPARTRNDFWASQLSELRENPGRNKEYETGSSTTASYLKGRYGLITATRARTDGKIALFVQYPAKSVDGKLVPDEAKVASLKAQYGPKNKDES